MNTKYKISVIMAVYNAELFLEEAVDSLIKQDIGFENIQLILVNDGSSDRSGAICDHYAANYPDNVLVVHKENGGVASARNAGLPYATGKYLNFMDSDDKMSLDAFRKMFQFFEEHEQETDIVTIPLQFFDAAQGDHWQNDKFSRGTRIIDLCTEPSAILMFVNASLLHCRIKEQIEFDCSLPCGEDIKVIYTLLTWKQTLGVVADTAYMYRRRSSGEISLVGSAKEKKSWYFEYFDNLGFWILDHYEAQLGYIPGFVQSMLAGEIQWRLMDSNVNNSNHLVERNILNRDEFNEYRDKLVRILQRLDDTYLILMTKFLYLEQKISMFLLKYDGILNTLPYSVKESMLLATPNGQIIANCSSFLNQLCYAKIESSTLIIEGMQSIPAFQESRVMMEASVNGKFFPVKWNGAATVKNVLDVPFLYKKPYVFRLPLSAQTPYEIGFYLNFNGIRIKMNNFQFSEWFPISNKISNAFCLMSSWVLQFKHNRLICIPKAAASILKMRINFYKQLWRLNYPGAKKAFFARVACGVLSRIPHRPIWLVSDRAMHAGDNGAAFFEFLQEKSKNKTDVRSYFVISKQSPDYAKMKKIGRTVSDRSFMHKLLFLMCSYNISSHASEVTLNPLWGHSEPYRDLMQHQRFVFLQHGVIKDDLSGWLERHKKNFFGFVTTALPEYDSIVSGNYNFPKENIWLTGLPRFDRLYHDEKKVITIMPTWRMYLFGAPDSETRIRPLKNDFMMSEYFLFYHGLLNHPKLKMAMEKYGYRLQFFPHPEVQNYLELFTKENIIPDKNVTYREIYAQSDLVLTDYSSACFDFAYLRKPIIYCQFDKEVFFSGEHIYVKGYFDYERDGFGEVEYDLESTVNRIIEYMENRCQLKDKYRQRIDNFFAYQDQNNCERLYQRIMECEQKRRR